jgi:predicted secreted protein
MKPNIRVFLLSLLLILPFAGQSSASTTKIVTISESSNGKKIQVATGSLLKITLHSTYWAAGATTNLKPIGTPTITPIMPSDTAPANCQHPGTGCGTVVWSYKVVKKGTAMFSATRTSCGEALHCSPEQMLFKVNVKVK